MCKNFSGNKLTQLENGLMRTTLKSIGNFLRRIRGRTVDTETVRGRVITQVLSMGTIDWIHGGGTPTRRLVVEDAGGLAITIAEDKIFAFTGLDLNDADFEHVGYVEVPKGLVDAALKFVHEKELFERNQNKFQKLIEAA